MAPRGKNFRADEERQLCYSFLHVSQDPLVGNGQKKEAFWERITAHFNANRAIGSDEMRSLSSLESKWGSINASVSKFSASYDNVIALNESGTSADDTLEKAKALYKASHSKGELFDNLGCWDVLKEVPKWQELGPMTSRKGKKLQPKKSLQDVTNLVDGSEETFPPVTSNETFESQSRFKRPIGNKSAKDMLKKQKLQEEIMVNQARASAQMADAILMKVRFLKEQSLAVLFSMKEDENMTEQGREFFRLRCEQELTRFKVDLEKERPEPTSIPVAEVGSAGIIASDQAQTIQKEDNVEVLHSIPATSPDAWGEEPPLE